MFGVWLVASVWAGGTAMAEQWDDLYDVHLGDDTLLVRDVVLDEGVATWRFSEGYAFPVLAGQTDPQPVGFAFVGTGSLVLDFPDPGQALAFANDAVRWLDMEPDALAPVVAGEPFALPFDDALVLSVDPGVAALVDAMIPVVKDGRVILDASDEYTVIVTDDRALGEARARAGQTLDGRARRSRGVGADLRSEMRREVLREALGERGSALLEVHTHTEHRFRRLLGFEESGGSTGQWLAFVRDDSGVFDSGLRAQLMVRGSEQDTKRGETDPDADQQPFQETTETSIPVPTQRTLLAEPFPLSDGVRLPPRRLTPTGGAAVVQIEQAETGMIASVQVEAALTLEAVGGDQRTLTLLIPRDGGLPWLGQPPFDTGWALRRVALQDGTRLAAFPVDEAERGGERPSRRGYTEVLVVLPEPLADGQSVTLEVEYAQVVRYAHVLETSVEGPVSMGTTTGMIPVMPVLAARPGAVFPVTLSVGVPAEGRYGVVSSGPATAEWVDERARWRNTVTTSPSARVAVGDWPSTYSDPAAMGLPAVRVQLFGGDRAAAKDLPVRVRQVVHFYQSVLPPYPSRQVDVVAVPPVGSDPDMVWANGIVGMRALLPAYEPTVRRDRPQLEFVGLARALAWQWWLAGELDPRDTAVADALSRSYAMLFLATGFGEPESRAWRKTWTECVRGRDKALPVALTTSWSTLSARVASDCVGPMVLGHMLREEVGDQAYLMALADVMGGEFTRDLEGLQAALEKRAERDLDAYFDFWVRSGHLPRVSLRYAVTDEHGVYRVRGVLESDVPFGTFRVPVLLRQGRDAQQVEWVTLVDGAGTLDVVSQDGKPKKVVLNPDYSVLLMGDRQQQVDPGQIDGPATPPAGR